MKTFFLQLLISSVLAAAAFATSNAQSASIFFKYQFEPMVATQGPRMEGHPAFEYNEKARKAGTQGILKATMILGADGKTRDIKLIQGLTDELNEEFLIGLRTLYFKPAMNGNAPIDSKLSIDLEITLEYEERDQAVKKAKATFIPNVPYPAKMRAEGHKGKVDVFVKVFADATFKVMGVSSTMPKEFDQAALEAAKGLKFEAATHKKNKGTVTQTITVSFDFKP